MTETATPLRERLPNRRRSATRQIHHAGKPYDVTVGFSSDGRPLEVFAHGAHAGTYLDALIDDVCIALSYLYQHGARPLELAQRFARTDQSVIGAIANAVASECVPVVELVWESSAHAALGPRLGLVAVREGGDPRPHYWIVGAAHAARARVAVPVECSLDPRRSLDANVYDGAVWTARDAGGAISDQDPRTLVRYIDQHDLWRPARGVLVVWMAEQWGAR